MKSRIKIKIIKKDEKKIIETPVVSKTISEQENSTKLASTVSGWVNEFHQRRREETESANEQFYS